MKILHVIDILNPGGAERMFLNITSLLAKDNVDVEVMLFSTHGSLTQQLQDGIAVHDLDRKNKFSISKLKKAHRICSSFEIVHVHMRHCYAYVRLAQILFGGKYKIILHDHFGDIEINGKVPFRLKRVFTPQYYIGVSDNLKKWAIANLMIDSKYCFLLENVIVFNSSLMYRYSASGNSFMVANVRPTKNIEFAIGLFKKAKVPLTIYGAVADSGYYEKLKPELEADSNLQMIEGVDDFSNHYDKYDLAVHCSKSETGPLVLLEYLAYGIPFLSYNTGAVADIVKQDLPRHFIDSFDEDEWIDRMEEIRSLGNISERLQNVYRKYFDTSEYVEKCKEIYRSVICS